VAKTSHNASAADTPEVPEKQTPWQEKLVPAAVLALVETLGVTGTVAESLEPMPDEHEVDYLVRVLPAIGDSVKQHMGGVADEIASLKRQLRSQKGAATKARNRITEIEEAARPRQLVPMAPVFDDAGEVLFAATELMTAIDSAEEVVLAFSDGRHEIRGVRPRKVRADGFRLQRGRVLFTDEPLEVAGPSEGEPAHAVHGIALLLDGEQAAYAPLSNVIHVGAGKRVNFAGSVIFM
jgi:hypothetical protein